MNVERTDSHKGFRLLLLVGALVSIAIALPALFAQDLLVSALGLDVPATDTGFDALARFLGSVSLVLAAGYLLAAADPVRQRGLLVVLFLVPLLNFVVLVAQVAVDDVSRPRGVLFAVLDLLYCLLYFRLFPRAHAARKEPTVEGS